MHTFGRPQDVRHVLVIVHTAARLATPVPLRPVRARGERHSLRWSTDGARWHMLFGPGADACEPMEG